MRISDWSSDVCSSDLGEAQEQVGRELEADVGARQPVLVGLASGQRLIIAILVLDEHGLLAIGPHIAQADIAVDRQRPDVEPELRLGIARERRFAIIIMAARIGGGIDRKSTRLNYSH